MSEEAYRAASDQIVFWQMKCCAHERMHCRDERVDNWPAVRLFQQTMRRIGEACFPVLLPSVPNENGGTVGAERAEAALGELALLRARVCEMEEAFLADSDTGAAIYAYIAAYDGGFAFFGKEKRTVGIDRKAFFVRDDRTGQELFRAKKFRQTRVIQGEKQHFALSSGMRRIRLSGPIAEERHTRMEVVTRALTPDDIHAIAPLEALFRASIETGNPVWWS